MCWILRKMYSALFLKKSDKLTFDVRIQNRNFGLHVNLKYTTGTHGPKCDWCDNRTLPISNSTEGFRRPSMRTTASICTPYAKSMQVCSHNWYLVSLKLISFCPNYAFPPSEYRQLPVNDCCSHVRSHISLDANSTYNYYQMLSLVVYRHAPAKMALPWSEQHASLKSGPWKSRLRY